MDIKVCDMPISGCQDSKNWGWLNGGEDGGGGDYKQLTKKIPDLLTKPQQFDKNLALKESMLNFRASRIDYW